MLLSSSSFYEGINNINIHTMLMYTKEQKKKKILQMKMKRRCEAEYKMGMCVLGLSAVFSKQK